MGKCLTGREIEGKETFPQALKKKDFQITDSKFSKQHPTLLKLIFRLITPTHFSCLSKNLFRTKFSFAIRLAKQRIKQYPAPRVTQSQHHFGVWNIITEKNNFQKKGEKDFVSLLFPKWPFSKMSLLMDVTFTDCSYSGNLGDNDLEGEVNKKITLPLFILLLLFY